MSDMVWLKNENCYARVVQRNVYFAIVEFEDNGDIVTQAVDDDEYEVWEERSIEYEHED